MKTYPGLTCNEAMVMEFYRGDKVLEGVEAQLKEMGIKDAIITSGIGSLQRLKIHLPSSLAEVTEDVYKEYEGPLEVCSLTGTVINGKCHVHISVMNGDKVVGGHMEYGCEVLYLIELTLIELKGLHHERRVSPDQVMKLYPIDSE